MKTRIVLFFLFLTMTCAGCEKEMPNDPDADAQGHTPPTSVTVALNNTINQAIHLFGDAEIYFGCHQWPIWGNEKVMAFMKKQRDLYKYIHDQTLRLANSGCTPIEIAEQIELPETLRNSFSNRDYYGTLSHNAKGVYQAYFGCYDANPANIETHARSFSAHVSGIGRNQRDDLFGGS